MHFGTCVFFQSGIRYFLVKFLFLSENNTFETTKWMIIRYENNRSEIYAGKPGLNS